MKKSISKDDGERHCGLVVRANQTGVGTTQRNLSCEHVGIEPLGGGVSAYVGELWASWVGHHSDCF